jgi:hypothetical protein
MKYGIDDIKMIPVERVYLDKVNPRHEPMETQDEVIEYLMKDEYVLPLAADIAKHGLSPLEAFAVLENEQGGRKKTFTVAEGNRRLCAIMLLNDPDLAPAAKRKEFEELAAGSDVIPSKLFAVVFDNQDEVDLWIERLHGGHQGGSGRRQWNPEQKTRHTGSNANSLAQAVLDIAQSKGFISDDDRKGKLTTAQRYLNNTQLKEAFGIDTSGPDGLSRTRSKKDFDRILQKFVNDLVDGAVHSRQNKDDIIAYARDIGSMDGISNKRIAPEPVNDEKGKPASRRARKKTKPKKRTRISYNEDVHSALESIPSYKLEKLYHSLTNITLDAHTPLLAVGLWAFMETLTALCGREGTDMYSFLSAQKLRQYGITERGDIKSIREIIKKIAEYGNTTKHHHKAAMFNGEQLANDVDCIEKLIITLANEAMSVQSN